MPEAKTITQHDIDKLVTIAIAGRGHLLGYELDKLIENQGIAGKIIDQLDDPIYQALGDVICWMVQTANGGKMRGADAPTDPGAGGGA